MPLTVAAMTVGLSLTVAAVMARKVRGTQNSICRAAGIAVRRRGVHEIDQQVRVVASGLSFANGIALASDGSTLFVTETGRYRIWTIDGRASSTKPKAKTR